MMQLTEILPKEIRFPEQPKPLYFYFQESIPEHQLRFARNQEERDYMYEMLKRNASRALAEHIAKHCKWMEISTPEFGNLTLRLELTIADKGAYKNYNKVAHADGYRDGFDKAVKSLPYGLEDAKREFYE